ncbi:hypothetical protein E2C01_016979 [Portunus trituberculatus]|uniref:Secreted protein n=1 Tax=Portunus trituberculatus TaxID=210409 RepID=A0A5B7DR26_PORTR|nr:hypothetical protein [Portunus trituberculatus]
MAAFFLILVLLSGFSVTFEVTVTISTCNTRQASMFSLTSFARESRACAPRARARDEVTTVPAGCPRLAAVAEALYIAGCSVPYHSYCTFGLLV